MSDDPRVFPGTSFSTLGVLVEASGIPMLEVVTAPRGLDVALVRPVVVGGLHDFSVDPGDLVLCLGVDVASPDVLQVIARAAEADAAALVFRVSGRLAPATVASAEAARLALLTIPGEMTWDQFYALAEAAITSATASPLADVAPGDLSALADAVAALVGGPVTIEDVHSRVLAYSNDSEVLDEPRRQSILERRTPEEWRRKFHAAGVYRKFWTTDDVVRIEEFIEEGLAPRLAVAVRAGGEVLGSIWVAESDQPLGPASEAALSEASRMAAVHLLRQRTTADVERRVRADLLRSLLQGRGDSDLATLRLGLGAMGPFIVVAFAPGAGPDLSIVREQLLDIVGLCCEAETAGAACVVIGTTVYVLLPCGDRAVVAGLARDVIAHAENALGLELRAGIGSSVPSVREATRSSQEAEQAVAAITRPDEARRVAHVDDVRSKTVLAELRNLVRDWPPVPGDKIRVLEEYDSKHNSGYVDTLRAYLECFADVAKASASLGIHANTFRYRLRRLSQLAAIDLADPEERLAAELRLRLWTSTPTITADCP